MRLAGAMYRVGMPGTETMSLMARGGGPAPNPSSRPLAYTVAVRSRCMRAPAPKPSRDRCAAEEVAPDGRTWLRLGETPASPGAPKVITWLLLGNDYRRILREVAEEEQLQSVDLQPGQLPEHLCCFRAATALGGTEMAPWRVSWPAAADEVVVVV
ncbi:unnamed protein product, partial [Polarella glacialis]